MEFSNILYDNFMSDQPNAVNQQTGSAHRPILHRDQVQQQQVQQQQVQQQQVQQQSVQQQQVQQQSVQQQQPVYSPPQIIFIQQPKMTKSFEKYPAGLVTVVSWIQIFSGLMSIILGIANPLTCGLYGMVGVGVWGGVVYFIAGVFGLLSARRKTSQTIVTHMVLSIVGCVCGLVQLALSVTAAYYDDLVYGCYYYRVINERSIDYRGTVAVDALLAVLGILEGIVAIIASASSCKVVCCSSAFIPVTTPHTTSQNGFGGAMNAGTMVYYNTSPTGDMNGNGPAMAQAHGYHGSIFTTQHGKRNEIVSLPRNPAPPYSYSPPTYTPSLHY